MATHSLRKITLETFQPRLWEEETLIIRTVHPNPVTPIPACIEKTVEVIRCHICGEEAKNVTLPIPPAEGQEGDTYEDPFMLTVRRCVTCQQYVCDEDARGQRCTICAAILSLDWIN